MLGSNGIPSSAGANWENLVEGGESKTLSAVKMELNKFRVTCDSKQQAQDFLGTLCSKGPMFHHRLKFVKFHCLKKTMFLHRCPESKQTKPEPQDLAGNYNMSLNEIQLPASKPSYETCEQCFKMMCIK